MAGLGNVKVGCVERNDCSEDLNDEQMASEQVEEPIVINPGIEGFILNAVFVFPFLKKVSLHCQFVNHNNIVSRNNCLLVSHVYAHQPP